MTEFVVMTSGVLLILFLVVPMLAKLLDMSFQTQQMARYMAWERTVWYDNGDQPSETTEPGDDIAVRGDSAIDGSAQKRLLTFAATPEALSAGDVSGVPTGTQHALWRWSSGGQMLNGGGLAGGNLNPEKTPSVAYEVLDVYNEGMDLLTSPLTMIGVGGGADGNFLLIAHPQDNYFMPTVSTSVNLANTGLESSALPASLNITASSAILADGWNAQGEHHFRSRADDFAIGTLMDNSVVNAMISFIGVFEPSFRDVDFGYIGTDPIPEAETKCDFGFCYFDE